MILDESSIERSALHALELLDAEEGERFEREMRINPDLATCTAEFRDVGAQVAIAGCRELVSPPLGVLTGALERIGLVGPARTQPHPRFRHWPGVLAACAALLVLVGGSVTVIHRLNEAGRAIDSRPYSTTGHRGDVGKNGDKIVFVRNGETIGMVDASERAARAFLERFSRLEQRPASDLIQDVARLKRELASWRKAEAGRFSAGPRVARISYFEMVEPGSETQDSQFFERITESVNTSIGLDVGATAAGDPEPIGAPDAGGKKESAAIVFKPEDTDALPDLRGLAEEVEFFYPDFPTVTDDYKRIDPGRYWDRENQRIWIETADEGVYKAVVPPANFDPDFPEDYVGIVPAAGSLAGPVFIPDPAAIEEPIETPQPAVEPGPGPAIDGYAALPEQVAASPVAVTIYEETTGRGSVVIGNLPPAGEGMAYQLWMRNNADDQPVSVGILPTLEAGSERFEFDLLGPGITPAGFFLTLESAGGVETPGETVVLEGP